MRIGILGSGQLGRMLALAGYPLGLTFRFFDETAGPAGQLADVHQGRFDDLAALDRFADGLDVVTYEFENVPVAAARHLAARLPVHPPPMALETAQDRLSEKTLFKRLGIQTPEFAAVSSLEELHAATAGMGLPAVLKTRRLGYDGKGQAVLRSLKGGGRGDIEAAWARLEPAPLILERFVPFDREISIIAARSASGDFAVYPLVQNVHREGILRTSVAPAADVPAAAREAAVAGIRTVMESLGYIGVLAIEWFLVGDRLLANEMAPRVHNSGHWTIDGAATSQFENHLRAILGWPLGPTDARGHAGMVNLIGHSPPASELAAIPGAKLHLYGKEPRPGRKIGHVNVCCASEAELMDRMAAIGTLIGDR